MKMRFLCLLTVLCMLAVSASADYTSFVQEGDVYNFEIDYLDAYIQDVLPEEHEARRSMAYIIPEMGISVLHYGTLDVNRKDAGDQEKLLTTYDGNNTLSITVWDGEMQGTRARINGMDAVIYARGTEDGKGVQAHAILQVRDDLRLHVVATNLSSTSQFVCWQMMDMLMPARTEAAEGEARKIEVTKVNQEQAEPVEETVTFPFTTLTAKGGLNVCLRPSKSSPVVVTLRRDREVTVLSEENGWYKIHVSFGSGEKEGYVLKDSVYGP